MPGRSGVPRSVTTVRLEGPFFRQDAGKVVTRNIELLLGDFADEMEGEVRRQIEAHAGQMPFYTGRTTGTVKGRVRSNAGRQWHKHAVVSANTSGMGRKDAIRIKAAASGIERRWHPFRRVATKARRITRDLAKGLN